MFKKIIALSLTATTLFSLTNETDITQEAVTYLNQLRDGAHLIPLESSNILSQAAQNHANYLSEEKTFGHQETNQNNSYYTGEWSYNRVTKLGYNYSYIAENISLNQADVKSSIDDLFQAVYHRLGFLSFDISQIGAALSQIDGYGNCFVYDMATPSSKTILSIEEKNPPYLLWPYPNYTQAQPAFFNDEYPDPLPECRQNGSSGNPISIMFNPKKSKDINNLSLSLKDEYGQNLAIKYVKQDLAHQPSKSFIYFPMQRLDWDTNYTATFVYTEDGVDKDLKWNFHTRKTPFTLINAYKTDKTYDVVQNDSYSLYMKPKDCNDLTGGYSYNPSKIDLLDQVDLNTRNIKIKGSVGSNFSIKQEDKEYKFHIFAKEIETISFSDVTSNSVTIHWSHEKSDEVKGYKIYRDGKLIYRAKKDERSYIDRNLEPNHQYNYTVKVTNEDQSTFAKGDFGNINLTPSYEIPSDAYFINIINPWEIEAYGGYPKGSKIITYEFRDTHGGSRKLNPNFVKEVSDFVGGDKDALIILICHTGGRTGAYGDKSQPSAAKLLSENGFDRVYHIMGGVEGENNWKDNNLPWVKR